MQNGSRNRSGLDTRQQLYMTAEEMQRLTFNVIAATAKDFGCVQRCPDRCVLTRSFPRERDNLDRLCTALALWLNPLLLEHAEHGAVPPRLLVVLSLEYPEPALSAHLQQHELLHAVTLVLWPPPDQSKLP